MSSLIFAQGGRVGFDEMPPPMVTFGDEGDGGKGRSCRRKRQPINWLMSVKIFADAASITIVTTIILWFITNAGIPILFPRRNELNELPVRSGCHWWLS